MKYCSDCGATVEFIIPEADNRHRHVCLSCRTIHYSNPKIVAGCIPVNTDGRILLCRRAIEPRYGLWTLPAGFMENEESTTAAAVRETLEEANARVEVDDLYMVINLPHVNQVYMMYRSRLLDEDFSAGAESLEVALYGAGEIPWGALAFAPIRETLRFYLEDAVRGDFRIRTGVMLRDSDGYRFERHT